MTPKDPAENIADNAQTSEGKAGATEAGATEKGPSQATKLVQLAAERFRVLLGEDGSPYAVLLDGPNLALPMRGRDGLRQLLARAYYVDTKTAPSATALTDALSVLSGEAAEFDREPVALRLARHQGAIVIDLGTADGRCVIVRPGRWEVADRSPILFRRTALTGEMPIPVAGGDVAAMLNELVNASETEVRLIVGYLIAGLIPDLPHPILAVFGEQGTAKTTLMRLLASIIDPSPAPTRTAPRDIKQWAVTAAASWFIGLDNVSTVSEWQSDAYCRAVTGDALTDRALYTDGDVSVIAFRRLLALTSIDAGSLRGDLGDRMLPIELDRIDPRKRRTDAEVTATFTEAAPELLGGLLDLLASVLDKLPEVRPAQLPRMADFARILAALDLVQGWTTVDDYAGTAADIAETVIDSDPFAVAVRDLAVNKMEWSGTAAELHTQITPDKAPKGWPRSPRAVSGAVRRITPALRHVGVSVEHGRESGGNRTRTITLRADRDGRDAGDGRDEDSDSSSVAVTSAQGNQGTSPDNSWEPPSGPSLPSRQRADQHERRDANLAQPSHLFGPAEKAGRSATQPSRTETAPDLHERQIRDGRDGWDTHSHDLSGDPCGECGAKGPTVVNGFCRSCREWLGMAAS